MDTVSSIHFPPSFLMRGQTLKFPRSTSSKEASRSDPTLALPPRLSSASLHHHSHSSTPRLSFTADAASHRCISSVLRKDGQILCIAAANGLVYTGSQASTVRVWKMPEFTECGHLKTKACMVVALQVSNDRVFAAYADCKIRVWRRTCEGAVKHVRIATVPAPGSFLRGYISGHDKTSKHLGPISSLAINTNDDVLYSASLDKTVKVWRISDFKCIETIQAHLEPINALALAAADGALYTASDDATVRVWRRGGLSSGPRSHSLTVTLPTKHSPAKALALAADGGVLYAGCTDGYVHYWLKGCFSGQMQHGGALPGHTHAVMCLASAGTFLATGSADSTSRVWAREADGSHSCVAVLQGHRGPVRCVAAFPDDETGEEGCTVCTGSLDGVLKVWRVRNSAARIHDSAPNARDYFDLT